VGARLILQQALEDELSEFLGRDRYERRGEPVSHRNGYEPVTVTGSSAFSKALSPATAGSATSTW